MQGTKFLATVRAAVAADQRTRQGKEIEVDAEGHLGRVTGCVLTSAQRGEVPDFSGSPDSSATSELEAHVQRLLAQNGFGTLEDRLRQFGCAQLMQAQLQAERRNRRKDRILSVARTFKSCAFKEPDDGGHSRRGSNSPEPAEATQAESQAEPASERERWGEVQAFKTQEEALRFVIECQPIDYQPETGGWQLPRFDGSREAYAYVLKMRPMPSHFVSTSAEFRRRLRIRLMDPGESKANNPAKALLRRSVSSILHKSRATTMQDAKPWMVEASGPLFDRPATLRDLRECGTRFFIAVAPDMEKRVLAEGFKVTKRCSVPCSATPQEALAAYSRHEERAGRRPSFRASVLVVNLVPDMNIDVIGSRQGGFRLRCRELPPSCLARLKRSGGCDGG